MLKWGNGGNAEMGKWGNGEMGKWGNGTLSLIEKTGMDI